MKNTTKEQCKTEERMQTCSTTSGKHNQDNVEESNSSKKKKQGHNRDQKTQKLKAPQP